MFFIIFLEQKEILNNKKIKTKYDTILMANIITSYEKSSILSLCLYFFLLVYTFQDTDNSKNYASLPISIKIAKKMFSKYTNKLKDEYVKESKIFINYTSWLEKWRSENKEFSSHLNDSFYSILGYKIIDILNFSEIISLGLIKTPDNEHPYYAIQIKDKSLMSWNVTQSIINLPIKLPMICPPKPYGPNMLGGYLLNDEKFSDKLLVDKQAYALTSTLSVDNKIYSLVNNISNIPFKINQDLLDYINNEGIKHNLLIDPYAKHKFEDLNKTTRYQQSVYASHNSKVILQETILGISEFYRRFSKIYFPVRLDQTGRIYCVLAI